MKRRSKVSGHRFKTRRQKASKLKHSGASEQATRVPSSLTNDERDITRLSRELKQAREQQAATSDVLRVISSSRGDLEPIFGAMLENAVRICNAKFGNIYRWDGDALMLVATYNTPVAWADARKRSPLLRFGPKNPVGHMINTKTTVHVVDAKVSEALYRTRPGDSCRH